MSKIVIIGAGAAGLTCAIKAAKNKNEVIVVERNDKCGKKILLTGNGRCNFWNEDQDILHYHSNDEDTLKKILTDNNINNVLPFLSSIGVISKIKNGYYYPYTNQAITIRELLYKECVENNVKFLFDTYVEDIIRKDDKLKVITNNKEIITDKVVVATGSKAFPKTGSDGNFYKILENMGHKIIKPLPALVQLKTEKNYLKEAQGVRVDVNIKLYENDVYIKEEDGELQITDYGISGICAMQLSGKISRGLDNGRKEKVIINFFPVFSDSNNLLVWLNERNTQLKNRDIKELLDGFLNYKITNLLLKMSNIKKTKWEDLEQQEKLKLVSNITSFNLPIIGTNSFDKSQVVTGGVSLTNVNPETMESLIKKNIYIIGEILDVDGDCGGYNLGFAWISGLIAGDNLND